MLVNEFNQVHSIDHMNGKPPARQTWLCLWLWYIHSSGYVEEEGVWGRLLKGRWRWWTSTASSSIIIITYGCRSTIASDDDNVQPSDDVVENNAGSWFILLEGGGGGGKKAGWRFYVLLNGFLLSKQSFNGRPSLAFRAFVFIGFIGHSPPTRPTAVHQPTSVSIVSLSILI